MLPLAYCRQIVGAETPNVTPTVNAQSGDALLIPRPDAGVEKYIPGRRLPDQAEQRRGVQPLPLRGVAVYLTDEPKPLMNRQLADHAPHPERTAVVPIDAAAAVDVERDRPHLSAHDTDPLESDTALVRESRGEQEPGLDGDAPTSSTLFATP